MKKRSHLFILGAKVKLIYRDIGEDAYAEYKSHGKEIYLNTNKNTCWEDYPVESLLHESIHAAFDISGWSTFLKSIGLAGIEESLAEMIENSISPSIRFK